MFNGSCILYHPKDIVDVKTNQWHRKWAPPISDPDGALGDVLGVIQQAIRDDPEPLPVRSGGCEEALKTMKSRAGTGVDCHTPCDVERLPDKRVTELCMLYNTIEHLLVWPAQTTLIIGHLIPKH
eukprot:8168905-Pyramimonas_sp.AAC.1